MPPIQNSNPSGLSPQELEEMNQRFAAEAPAIRQRNAMDASKDWLDLQPQLAERNNAPAKNDPRFMRGQQTRTANNYGKMAQQPFDDGGNFVRYGDYADKMNAQRGYLQSLAGDTNYMDPARAGFVEPPQARIAGPQQRQALGFDPNTASVQSRLAAEQAAAGSISGLPENPIPRPTVGGDPFAWEKGVAHDPHAANAEYWRQVQASRTPMEGGITPAFRHAAYSDPMGAITKGGVAAAEAAPAAAGAATAGGRVAGAARGAMGAFGGLPGLAAFGVINNAVDLADPNSVMRKSIHDGNYGTALARGAVNFIPGGGTVWDVLAGNSHPEQPTVNKPQQEQQPLDLTGLFTGNADPLAHGNYTSRKEAMNLYKLQKTFEPKPAVEAAQNQMKMLSRDLQAAMASGDKTRIQTAYKNYNDFERLLALGQNSYPYMTGAMTPVEHEWLGGEGY